MYKHLMSICFFLLIKADIVAATEFYEEAREYIRIEIDHHNDTIGLIWAYRCLSCTPRRFLFDSQTIVEQENKKYGVSRLKSINGKAATVIWMPNTSKALRIMPMEFN